MLRKSHAETARSKITKRVCVSRSLSKAGQGTRPLTSNTSNLVSLTNAFGPH